MQFNVGCSTDIGQKRQQNQDSMAAIAETGLFIVADGMGGHRGGEIASSMATEIISQITRAAVTKSDYEPKKAIQDAIQQANRKIFERSLQSPELRGMGTTTTALLFGKDKAFIGHVGDSRCYFIRDRSVWQLTRDHSLVQEKFRAGLISREQLKTDQMKNVITRSVGFEAEAVIDVYEMAPQPGDIFLLCSDGLSGLVDDSEILETIHSHLEAKKTLQSAAETLIKAANAHGGNDNITAVITQVANLGTPPPTPPGPTPRREPTQ